MFTSKLPSVLALLISWLLARGDRGSNLSRTITCDFEATPALQLKAFRQKGEKVEVSHYRVNVNRFRARLNIICVTEKMLADIKCDGWPDVRP
ncbi:unnamed protein product [Timema podura]|uniref:Uncharacterized protein n=1 Tax=Timema podura TaxID=61482 RepID=A0ABN7NBU1_TIMPD|nr:unnamed protein product [Timema podura]